MPAHTFPGEESRSRARIQRSTLLPRSAHRLRDSRDTAVRVAVRGEKVPRGSAAESVDASIRGVECPPADPVTGFKSGALREIT